MPEPIIEAIPARKMLQCSDNCNTTSHWGMRTKTIRSKHVDHIRDCILPLVALKHSKAGRHSLGQNLPIGSKVLDPSGPEVHLLFAAVRSSTPKQVAIP